MTHSLHHIFYVSVGINVLDSYVWVIFRENPENLVSKSLSNKIYVCEIKNYYFKLLNAC